MREKMGSASEKRAHREHRAWYLYDFGNSAYAAVVLLAIYSAYFKDQVVGGAEGSRLWGLSVGIAMLAVAITSPILGAIADFTASKKRMLALLTALSCICTALLFFVQPGDIVIGMVFFILAEIGYRGAQVFYNALLPEIAEPEEMNRVSGTGWAIGSGGGIICLLIILPLIMFIEGTLVVRFSFLITALFYAVSAIPLFVRIKERAKPQALPDGETYLSIGFRQLSATFRQARHFRQFIKFMIAFLIYNDGIIMALDFAAILGAVLFGFDQQKLILMVIVVQVTSIVGAHFFGLMAQRMSGKKSLIVSLLLMLVAIFWLYFAQSAIEFWFIASLAGFALTGVQSVSRAMVGILSPPGQSAEFYGLFAVSGRTSSFIGPTIYGWLALATAHWYEGQGMAALAAEQAGQRIAVLSIAIFLGVGLVLLLTVNERKGRMAAETASLAQ